jgi:hypothetical protein
MKFSEAAILSLVVGSTTAFMPLTVTQHGAVATRLFSTTDEEVVATNEINAKSYKKDDRLRMMKSEQFHRRGFKEVREDAEMRLEQEYMSDLVKDLKSSNYVMEKDGVKVYLAKVCVCFDWSLTFVNFRFLQYATRTILLSHLGSLFCEKGFWILLGRGEIHCVGL